MSLGSKISALRKRLGVSREKLARVCDISLSQMYKIEKDIHAPSVILASKIAKALKTTIDNLLK